MGESCLSKPKERGWISAGDNCFLNCPGFQVHGNVIHCFIAIILLWERYYSPYFTEVLENGLTKTVMFKHWKIYFCLWMLQSWTFYFREVTEVTKEVSWNYSESLFQFNQPFCLFSEKAVCPFYFLVNETVRKAPSGKLVGICLALRKFGNLCSLNQNFFNTLQPRQAALQQKGGVV